MNILTQEQRLHWMFDHGSPQTREHDIARDRHHQEEKVDNHVEANYRDWYTVQPHGILQQIVYQYLHRYGGDARAHVHAEPRQHEVKNDAAPPTRARDTSTP